MASAFDDFVKRKTAQTKQFDREERIKNFVDKLKELDRAIHHFLKNFTETQQIRITKNVRTVHEELLGSYNAPALEIAIGETVVELKPVGTILLGGIGRADLVGPTGSIIIVLAHKDLERPKVTVSFGEDAKAESKPLDWSEWQWKIAVREPTLRYLELDKDSFQSALMSVAG